ncbi:MAG: hypothetical protein H6670_15155 [Anaerolineaceae bacterium]|nr:hypothetical protein [Anaerolineaceae bacterium]
MLKDMPRDVVIASKQQHLKTQQQHTPESALRDLAHMQPRPLYLDWEPAPTIIAHITRSQLYDPIGTAIACLHYGADAIAFFTDHTVYGDANADLNLMTSAIADAPVIDCNYLLDAYCVVEARAAGASAIWTYSDMLPPEALREVVSTAQRWKMPIYLQITSETDLDLIDDLAPHVLCYEGDISELDDLRQSVPSNYQIMPAQVCQVRSEVESAVQQPVAAVMVEAHLFEDMRFVNWLAGLRGKSA